MKYIQAMRPVMGILSSLLCLAALRFQAPTFAQQHPFRAACLLIAVFCGTAATMVWNDFTDREHDARKGKCHALENKHTYATLARRLWCVCAFTMVWAAGDSQIAWMQIGIFALCLIGIFYPSTYRFPGLATVTVGAASASPTLFAMFLPQPRALPLGIALFMGVLLTICARELLKDIEDVSIDGGYKATVPVCWGIQRTRWLASGLLLGGAAVLASITFGTVLVLLPVFMTIGGLTVCLAKKPEFLGK